MRTDVQTAIPVEDTAAYTIGAYQGVYRCSALDYTV